MCAPASRQCARLPAGCELSSPAACGAAAATRATAAAAAAPTCCCCCCCCCRRCPRCLQALADERAGAGGLRHPGVGAAAGAGRRRYPRHRLWGVRAGQAGCRGGRACVPRLCSLSDACLHSPVLPSSCLRAAHPLRAPARSLPHHTAPPPPWQELRRHAGHLVPTQVPARLRRRHRRLRCGCLLCYRGERDPGQSLRRALLHTLCCVRFCVPAGCCHVCGAAVEHAPAAARRRRRRLLLCRRCSPHLELPRRGAPL